MRGICSWCGCPLGWHTGRVPEAIKNKPEYRNVRWSKSACANPECKGCRTYEK